ncbi:metK [Lepeophtheirus salmonis]|uniref:S-adenosylmethionine synthase n=1 Tax=Lepeophtheirus salmonis TaxID=72036 RepID=A0A7R8HD67_LEPSM|nr:metK [Lepeophtheirus salmonis]CAF3004218.1 metK [Lepeophtheirus salmonis]
MEPCLNNLPKSSRLVLFKEMIIDACLLWHEKKVRVWKKNSKTNDETFFFTSESVAQDPDAKVACEVVTKTGMVFVFGEITSNAKDINYQRCIVRNVVRDVGYDHTDKGFDFKTCCVLICLETQSSNIASGVWKGHTDEDLGAGDQGIMFGYATDETEEAMPLTLMLAHKLNKKVADLRRSGELPWARPDTKAQVTCEYAIKDGACVPLRVSAIVLSVQHCPDTPRERIIDDLTKKVITSTVPERYLNNNTVLKINPCGRFVVGGPQCRAGLTGRKMIVDTYGGWGAHGGGAFSGKDYTKVDRSGAYAVRQVAKSLVKSGICKRCLVQVSYAIGVAHPISIAIFDYSTSDKTQEELQEIVKSNFDLRPGIIAHNLDLKKPIYLETAKYGHFGKDGLSWERTIDLREKVKH